MGHRVVPSKTVRAMSSAQGGVREGRDMGATRTENDPTKTSKVRILWPVSTSWSSSLWSVEGI